MNSEALPVNWKKEILKIGFGTKLKPKYCEQYSKIFTKLAYFYSKTLV